MKLSNNKNKIKLITKYILFIFSCIGFYATYLTISDNTNKELGENIKKDINNSELNLKSNIQISNDNLEENVKIHVEKKLNNIENLKKIISFYESGEKNNLYKMINYSFKTKKISSED